MNSADFRKQKKNIISELHETTHQLDKGYREARRVRKVVENTRGILDDLDREFSERTGLTGTDITFLFLAAGLQIARWFFLNNKKFRFDRASEGDDLMDDALSLAPPDWRMVLLQSVPYDATRLGIHVTDTGLGGSTHRYRTLGHDPILGWIFGTANIMTNSLTKNNLETFQVKNMYIIRHYPGAVCGMMQRAVTYGIQNPKLLAVSVARQAIHFGSDYFTKQGLPVPIVSTVNDEFAGKMLSQWHIDMWSITRSATLAIFINQLIAIIHRLFFDGHTAMDKKLYEVRTRKIITYSNIIAEAANAAFVVGTEDFSKLDIGGIGVAIYKVITNRKFIHKMKEEFIFGSYQDMIMGNDTELDYGKLK